MAERTPTQIQRFLDDNLHRFDLGVQYLGDEPNAVRRPWDDATVRWCLAASWIYEAAAGNSSIPAVYDAVNRARPDFLADRTYLPSTPRDMKLLESHGIPMFGIESKHQFMDFDIVGTSISYPVLSMSFVKMLAMSDIPIRWKEREHDPGAYPMVLVGGQSYGAPEVLAPVVDCWWLGEVEDEPGNPGIGAVAARISGFRASAQWHHDRLSCYQALAREFNFLYFPRYVDVHYATSDRTHVGAGPHPSKQVVGYSSNLTGMRMPLRKRHVKNLDNVATLDAPPLLYADPAMGSGDLEVARGCPAWCSFCALTYRQKPYRQRSVDKTIEHARTFAANMGSVRMAPFSPDFPMHTEKKRLVAGLLEHVSDEVDAPTMRVDDFIADEQFMLLQVHGGMDAVTLGVEGNSQRMRDLVGKGTSDEDIKQAVIRGIRAGIRKFKLFVICNLPGEDEGDIMRVLTLGKDLADIRESMNQPTVRIQFSFTPLMVEANTPMQWFPAPIGSRLLGDAMEDLRELKIDSKIGAKAQPDKLAFFQTCQRASRDIGEALVDAMEATGQACWGGLPRTFTELLESKLKARGFANGYLDCFDERDRADLFGWEFIDQGVSVDLMWRAYAQMRQFVELTDSHTYDQLFDSRYHGNEWIERCDTRCQGKSCGACDYTDLKIRTGYIRAVDRDIDLARVPVLDQRTQAVRVRARVSKPERYRLVDNAHRRYALRRAAFRAHTALGFEPGDGITKRYIQFASDQVRPRDWTCGTDYVEFAFTRHHTTAEVDAFTAEMNTHLDPWMRIERPRLHPAGATTLIRDADTHLYEIPVDELPEILLDKVAAWHAATDVPMRLRVQAGYFAPAVETVDAKTFTVGLWAVRSGHRAAVRMLLRGRPSPYNVLAALLDRPTVGDLTRLAATRLEVFLGSDRTQQDFLRPNCVECGLQIPTTVLDDPYDPHRCPLCADQHAGLVITGRSST